MKTVKVLFIHHSTGGLLLLLGNVRKLLKQKAPDIELWDHGYNLFPIKIFSYLTGLFTFKTGLSDGKGRMTGRDFDITISNNSPEEYAEIFSRNSSDFTLKQILQFDVIAFKNCFSATKIETIEKLERFKKYYTSIIKNVSKYPNRFIVFTPPPLRKENTKPVWAENARKLADWLKTKESGNVRIFDFFDLLTDKTGDNKNMLKREYCNIFLIDSHPNIRANREAGKEFVNFLTTVTR